MIDILSVINQLYLGMKKNIQIGFIGLNVIAAENQIGKDTVVEVEKWILIGGAMSG